MSQLPQQKHLAKDTSMLVHRLLEQEVIVNLKCYQSCGRNSFWVSSALYTSGIQREKI